MVFLTFGGEPSPYAQEHLHRPDRSEPWVWMGATVAVLTVLSVIGGWVQIPGIWQPFTDFLEPTVEPLVEASGTQEFLASLFAVGLAVAGIALAWAVYSVRTLRVPRAQITRTVLEHKFYFDELYDAVFYRPAVLLAVTLRDWVERPLVLGSLGSIGAGARKASTELREVQTGLVRTYALAIAGSVTVLAFVFVWVK
jgi:NADH-quinone oxidoreductase subunit L